MLWLRIFEQTSRWQRNPFNDLLILNTSKIPFSLVLRSSPYSSLSPCTFPTRRCVYSIPPEQHFLADDSFRQLIFSFLVLVLSDDCDNKPTLSIFMVLVFLWDDDKDKGTCYNGRLNAMLRKIVCPIKSMDVRGSFVPVTIPFKNKEHAVTISMATCPVHVIGDWMLGSGDEQETFESPSRRLTFSRQTSTIDRLHHARSHYPTIWTSSQLRWHPFLEHTGQCSVSSLLPSHSVDISVSRKSTLTIPLIPTTTFPRINSTTMCSIGQDYLQR